jgi:AAA family ATP:ADP antiporter
VTSFRPNWGLVDVRRGELRPLTLAFVTLLIVITAHTALETVRDALVMTKLPVRTLGVTYAVLAACVLPTAALVARLGGRSSVKTPLAFALAVSAALLVFLFALPTTGMMVIALYVANGLIGAIIVPQVWNLIASMFTVAQGRRLFATISAGGVLGGALGSILAAALLTSIPVNGLLLVAASLLALTAIVVLVSTVGSTIPPAQTKPRSASGFRPAALRAEPFVLRIALLVVISTSALVAIDYFFKWTVARTVRPDDVPRFVARYYAVLNVAALVVQVFVSGPLVRKIGVMPTLAVTPLLLLFGGLGTLAIPGVLIVVLALKGLDETLSNSVHRVTSELVYLPLPESARARTKPFIDGVLARVTQAGIGGFLFLLAGAGLLSPRLLAGIVIVLALAWLLVGVAARGPYLGLLRRAIATNALGTSRPTDRIDLETAETLVQLLAHDDPLVVVGAMNALARRGRERLIPALVLLHTEQVVLLQALQVFASSQRDDWVGRARKLLRDERSAVRMAAARALSRRGRLDTTDLAEDGDELVRAYATLHLALKTDRDDAALESRIHDLVEADGKGGDVNRLGLLAAFADVAPDRRLTRLLAVVAERAGTTRESTEALARAASSQAAELLIPTLIARLASWESRDVVVGALVSFGARAIDAIRRALHDPPQRRDLRVHLPSALARFGTKHAAELLLEVIESDRDGLVRYKALRSLGRMVATQRVAVDRLRVERLAYANLVEHVRLLGVRAAFDSPPPEALAITTRREPTKRLLVGLLDDKLRQSLERAFRFLKIAHPHEDIHRVYVASFSEDARVRANAAEFIDTLLRRRDQRCVRFSDP